MDDLRSRVAAAIREHVSPAMDLHPEAIEVVALEDGVATLRLSEACQGCPAGLPRLIAEIESELCRQVPEVEIVEIVS
jgi:Fe-S cluster biogenesis protein NfuA